MRTSVLSLDEWMAIQTSSQAPTFFATPYWAAAVCESNPDYRIHTLRFTTGTTETALLPLLSVTGSWFRWRILVGMPFGTYTAILREDGRPVEQPLVDNVLLSLPRYAADSIELRLWPLGPQPERVSEALCTHHETSVIDLRRGSEAVLKSMEGSSRRMAGQAERKGVTCAPERGRAAVETYYDILKQAATKWGLEQPTISKKLLLAVSARGGNDVEIWLARFEGRPIAGGVVLYGRDEAFFWSAATVPDYAVLRANNALAVRIMLAALARGVACLNLGASEGLPGVQRFKRYLGATAISYDTIRLQRPIYRLYQSFRSRFNHPSS